MELLASKIFIFHHILLLIGDATCHQGVFPSLKLFLLQEFTCFGSSCLLWWFCDWLVFFAHLRHFGVYTFELLVRLLIVICGRARCISELLSVNASVFTLLLFLVFFVALYLVFALALKFLPGADMLGVFLFTTID